MALAIFDLDNTLLAGDSDYLWGVYLARAGVVDSEYYERENARFYRAYQEGRLDIFEFLRFSLRPLAEHPLPDLIAHRKRFLRDSIAPIILPAATQLVRKHRGAGDTLMIITATNAFITAPIAERLGVDHLLATDPEMLDGRYTGNVSGVPCFQEGKVKRLSAWLSDHGMDLIGSSFYTDSHNDVALLERVEQPFAVDPDPQLATYARKRNWPIISLREGAECI